MISGLWGRRTCCCEELPSRTQNTFMVTSRAKYQLNNGQPIFPLLTDIGLSENKMSCRVADVELLAWPSESEKILVG